MIKSTTFLTQGHGFRNDLFEMVKNLKPGFMRFPGMANKIIFRFLSFLITTINLFRMIVFNIKFYKISPFQLK